MINCSAPVHGFLSMYFMPVCIVCFARALWAVWVPDINSWPSTASYLRQWPSARSMPLNTVNLIWTEWCNNRSMWFLMDTRLWSQKTKRPRWHEWPLKERASEKKEKEQYLFECCVRIAITEKSIHSANVWSTAANSHRLYHSFIESNFPQAVSLHSYLYSPSHFLSPFFLVSLLSTTRFVRWHFQWETQMLPKHSSCVKSNSLGWIASLKEDIFFSLCPALPFVYLSQVCVSDENK